MSMVPWFVKELEHCKLNSPISSLPQTLPYLSLTPPPRLPKELPRAPWGPALTQDPGVETSNRRMNSCISACRRSHGLEPEGPPQLPKVVTPAMWVGCSSHGDPVCWEHHGDNMSRNLHTRERRLGWQQAETQEQLVLLFQRSKNG